MDRRTAAGIAIIVAIASLGVIVYELSGTTAPPPKHHLTIGIQGQGSTEPPQGNYTYNVGTSVTVTATANSGWGLAYWSLDGLNTTKTTMISVTMSIDHTLLAVFGIIPPPLNATIVYERDPPSFDPKLLDVKVGTTVEWVNAGNEIHTTTSSNGTWSSGIMNVGDRFDYTFTVPGRYTYYCGIHPTEMTGVIVVSPR